MIIMKKLLFIIPLLLIFVLSSCNKDKDKTTTTTSDTNTLEDVYDDTIPWGTLH